MNILCFGEIESQFSKFKEKLSFFKKLKHKIFVSSKPKQFIKLKIFNFH